MMERAIVLSPTLSSVNRLHTILAPRLSVLAPHSSLFLSSVSFLNSLRSAMIFKMRKCVTHRSGRFTLHPGTSWPRNDTESHLNPCKPQAVNPALTIRQVKQHFEGQAHPLSCRWCISELHDLLLNLPLYRQLMLNSHLRTGSVCPLRRHHIYTSVVLLWNLKHASSLSPLKMTY